MYKIAVAVLASVVAANVLGQDDATRMSKDELLSFLPGTKVAHTASSGSLRRWTNEPDGKFVASTDNKKYGSAMGNQPASARGTWMVNDEGKYCINIDWKRVEEKWCASVLKSADGTYYLNTVDPTHKIEFTK